MLNKYGAVVEWSARNVSNTNGVAERGCRTALQDVQSQLFRSTLQLKYWPSAARQAGYIRPRLGHKRGHKNCSPYQTLFGIPPSWRAMRPYCPPFGCKGWVAFSKSRQQEFDGGKWSDRGRSVHFLHKSMSVKGSVKVLLNGREYDVGANHCFWYRNRPSELQHVHRKVIGTQSVPMVDSTIYNKNVLKNESCPEMCENSETKDSVRKPCVI